MTTSSGPASSGPASSDSASSGPVLTDVALTGAELRWLTHRVRAIRAGKDLTDVLTDAAYTVLVTGLTAFYLWGIVVQARTVVSADDIAVTGLGPGLVQAIVLLYAVLAGLGGALRAGPAAMSPGGVRWWLPTPADRAGMLGPAVTRTALIAVAAGASAGAVAGVLAGLGGLQVLQNAVLGAALGAAVSGTAGVLQVRAPAATRTATSRAVDILLALVPVAAVAATAWVPSVPAMTPPWWVGAGIALAGVAGIVHWARHLDLLRAADLHATSAGWQQLQVAALSSDQDMLGRSWFGPARVVRRFTRLTGAARGPASSLLVADGLLQLRDPRTLSRLLSLAAIGVFAAQIPLLANGLGLWCLVLLVGLGAAGALARGAREAGANPRLDALLPLGGRTVRLVRAAWPVSAAAVVLAILSPTTAVPGALLMTLPAVAVVLGAAAIRTAYRGPVPWDTPMIATPMGAVNLGQMLHANKGIDLAVLGLLPLAWVLVAGPGPVVIAVQYALAAVALAVITFQRADRTR